MSDSDTATTYVIAPEDIVWHKTDLGQEFWLSDKVVARTTPRFSTPK